MAEGAAGTWQRLFHTPGNPQLPTIPAPNDPVEGVVVDFGNIADITVGEVPETILDVFGASPGTARGFAQTYLNKVGANPVPLDFAEITSQTDRQITFHNTNRNGVTLNSIDFTNLPELSNPTPSLPIVVPPFSSLVVTIRAPQDGVEEFDDTITFNFSSQTISVRVLGRRVLVFHVHPEQGIIEQLQFRTQLMRSKNATEQAMATRPTPRRILRMTLSLDDDEQRTTVSAIVLGGGPSLLFLVPQFQEARNLTSAAVSTDTDIFLDTTASTFEDGGKAHFRLPDDTTLDADIETVSDDRLTLLNEIGVDLPQDTFCMPAYNGRMTQFPRQDVFPVNMERQRFEFTFWDTPYIGEATPPASLTTTHPTDGLTILTAPNVVPGRSKSGQTDRNDSTVDNQTGVIDVQGTEPIGEIGSVFNATARNMDDIYAWRQLHHYLFGSWRKFYIPSYQDDLPISSDLSANASFIDVPNMGLARFLNARAPRRDIRVEHPEGVEFTRITSVTDNGATERLVISPVLTNTTSLTNDQVLISWLNLCRVRGDVMTLTHEYIGKAGISFRYRSVTE